MAGWTLPLHREWGEKKRGSVGRPQPGRELRVIDADTGAELPIDTPGRLEVRGRDTDWVRNTMAARGCTIHWKGLDYECTNPTFVGKEDALKVAKGIARMGVQRRDFPHGFLRLDRTVTR